MKNILSLTVVLIATLFLFNESAAQTTVTFKPASNIGKDAQIVDLQPTLNINDDKLSPYSWTHSNVPRIHRSLIEFTDLSQIPSTAIVSNAELKLYFKVNHPANPGTHSSSNDLYIRRIITPWTETGVTWNTQPITTTTNEVSVPASTSPTQDYTVNVTNLVQDIITSNNYGFMFSLQNETPYRLAIFASSDHIDSSLHPELEVTYTFPLDVIEVSKNSFNVYPNPALDRITVEKPNLNTNEEIQIYSITGQLVIRKKIEKASSKIDISGLLPGTYYIQSLNKESQKNFTEKLVVR